MKALPTLWQRLAVEKDQLLIALARVEQLICREFTYLRWSEPNGSKLRASVHEEWLHECGHELGNRQINELVSEVHDAGASPNTYHSHKGRDLEL